MTAAKLILRHLETIKMEDKEMDLKPPNMLKENFLHNNELQQAIYMTAKCCGCQVDPLASTTTPRIEGCV